MSANHFILLLQFHRGGKAREKDKNRKEEDKTTVSNIQTHI